MLQSSIPQAVALHCASMSFCILCSWQEDHKREDDFSRAMVATDDLACAHPAK